MNNTPDNAPAQPNYWREFRETLKERIHAPRKHPTFVMYFIGIIILFGGFSWWLEPVISSVLLGNWPEIEWVRLISGCYAYFVAIAATAAVDLILSLNQQKSLRMFFVVGVLCVFICAFFAAIAGTVMGNTKVAVWPSVIGYILALFLWWVGNANNANLLESPVKPDAPTGGDTQANPVGDLSDFTV